MKRSNTFDCSSPFFLALLLAALPGVALASGDPAVIYWFIGGVIAQVSCFIALCVRKGKGRLKSMLVYLVMVAGSWLWGWNQESVSVDAVGIILVLVPALGLMMDRLVLRAKARI